MPPLCASAIRYCLQIAIAGTTVSFCDSGPLYMWAVAFLTK